MDYIQTGCNNRWNAYLRTENKDVMIIKNPGIDELSMAELELLRRIYKEHENKDGRAMLQFTRNLPEYKTVQRGRDAIQYKELLSKNLDPAKHNIDEILKNIYILKKEEEFLYT